MKRVLVYMLAGMALVGTSCSDFLDTIPHDALSPSTTWQTEKDAEKFLIGCYDGWADETGILYWDCASDFGFNFHVHENYRNIGNGSMTASNAVADYYKFGMIRRCNDFLTNIQNIEFADAKKKDNMIGQVKTIRAYTYFNMNWQYGGVPIIDSYETAEEAQVPRNTEEEVKKYIYDELDAAIPMLDDAPAASGYIAKGTALAIKMRSALYYADYQRAKEAAKAIMDLGQYELDPSFENIFMVSGQNSKEIIAAVQHDENLYSNWMIATMYNNSDAGWSSMVPSKNLIDAYEMSNGLTKEEAGSGYDPVHPFANRDPRMAMTLYCPGDAWPGGDDGDSEERKPNKTFNLPRFSSLQSGINGANTRTGFYFKKYNDPNIAGNPNMSHTNLNVIRYPEVLLIYAEALYKTNGTLTQPQIDETINKLRKRVGMHEMRLEELAAWNLDLWTEIKRERRIEMTMDGMRYADILRWREGELRFGRAITGPSAQVCINDLGANPYADNGVDEFGDIIYEKSRAEGGARYFDPNMHYLWPVPYAERVKNPLLGQNPGWPQ